MQSLESQLTHRFELEETIGGGEHALGDQNLSGLGLTTQPCREIRHRADRTVIPAPLVADRANRGITLRDANAEFELIAVDTGNNPVLNECFPVGRLNDNDATARREPIVYSRRSWVSVRPEWDSVLSRVTWL